MIFQILNELIFQILHKERIAIVLHFIKIIQKNMNNIKLVK